ncbi:MAG: hypothetical protein ACRDHK_10700, partial [Actinomycetota bacterium]
MLTARVVTGRDYRRGRALLAVASAVVFVGLCRPANAQERPIAHSYVVVSSGLTTEAAAALGRALQVPIDGRIAGGAFQYADPDRFLWLPTVPVLLVPGMELNEDGEPVTWEGIDFRAVRDLSSPSRPKVLALVDQALRAAGISLTGATPRVSRTYFDAFGLAGRRWLHRPIATHVSFGFETPDGTPLVGPGAQADFSFGPDGRASLVWLATRELALGPDVPILSQAEAQAQCGLGAPPGAAVTADLVHYAPPLYMDVSTIAPHYRCGGSAPTDSGANEFLKVRYLPATLPGGALGPPTVLVTAFAAGPSVSAQADVTGGTPPYRITWRSANTPFVPNATEPTVSYDVTTRD